MNDRCRQRVAELVDRYGRMVFATAYRILGRADEAEDALQEVFLKLIGVWDGRLQTATVRDWGAYLRVMATRSAISLLRVRASRRFEMRQLRNDIAAPSSDEPAAQEKAERMQCLRRALTCLPERNATVFTLRYLEEMTYEQVAHEMNLSVSQVGVILHRTRNRLRKLVEEALEDSSVARQRVDGGRLEQDRALEKARTDVRKR